MITFRKRNLLFTLAISIFISGIASFFIIRESHSVESVNLDNNLSKMISFHKSDEMAFIDLSIIATFSWDKLYIFGPYTSSEMINESLGIKWLGIYSTSIEYNDGIALLVFTNKGKVVQYLEYPRGPECDFSAASNPEGYNRDDSRFFVDEKERCIPIK